MEESWKEVQNKYGNRIIGSHGTGNALLERASSRIHESESQEEVVSSGRFPSLYGISEKR